MTNFDPPPAVFAESPQTEEIIAAVNRSDAVEKMQSTSTTIEMLDSSLPISRLTATLAVQKPRRLRLRAGLPITLGSGLDVGSNDEAFWMRYPEGMHHTLLFARHDEYQQHMLGSPLPVDPTWIIEALGLVHIDPALVIQDPIPRGDGTLEIRTRVDTASGPYTRVLLVHAREGYVRDQYLYAPDGRLVASAVGSEHRYYAESRVVLPHSVRLQLQPNGAPPIGLKIEVGSYVLNQLLGDDPRMFEMPAEGNHQVIDLSKQSAILPPANDLPPVNGSPAVNHSPPPSGSSPLGPDGYPQPSYPRGAASPYTPPPPGSFVPPEPTRSYAPTAAYRSPYRGVETR